MPLLGRNDLGLKIISSVIPSIVRYFYGSTPDDFDQVVDTHPFKECPESPNCTWHAVHFDKSPTQLFDDLVLVMKQISPYKIDADSQSLQINAVFRIPVFGFKDDVKIRIKPYESDESILHIKSSSRIGESDLGVNRRRIKRILSLINQQIS